MPRAKIRPVSRLSNSNIQNTLIHKLNQRMKVSTKMLSRASLIVLKLCSCLRIGCHNRNRPKCVIRRLGESLLSGPTNIAINKLNSIKPNSWCSNLERWLADGKDIVICLQWLQGMFINKCHRVAVPCFLKY